MITHKNRHSRNNIRYQMSYTNLEKDSTNFNLPLTIDVEGCSPSLPASWVSVKNTKLVMDRNFNRDREEAKVIFRKTTYQ